MLTYRIKTSKNKFHTHARASYIRTQYLRAARTSQRVCQCNSADKVIEVMLQTLHIIYMYQLRAQIALAC